jgi:hypothetical protein
MRFVIPELLVAGALLCTTAVTGLAQEREFRSPKSPTPDEQPLVPDQPSGATVDPDAGQAESPLSSKLNRSGGVLQPPPTGDRGAMPPPNVGEDHMPVIPPPASSDGSQHVQPK